MTDILLFLLAAGGTGAAIAAVQQHRFYVRVRRERVDDRQPLWYGGGTFHGVFLLKLAASEEREAQLAKLRALRDAMESSGAGAVVYAGLVPLTMAPSSRLPNDWSAVVIAQFPSRTAFEQRRTSPEVQEALAGCERSYVHGFVRPPLMNLLVPIGLGLMRLRDIVLRRKPILPFQPLAEEDALPPLQMMRKEIRKLDAYRDIRDDAVVIVNLLQPGTPEQRAADRAYSLEMVRGMAEGGYGPMHMGRAVTVEGDFHYARFAAVYYPGIDHMHAMIGSAFMNRIAQGKQLGDTLAVATIPVLSKLEGAQFG